MERMEPLLWQTQKKKKPAPNQKFSDCCIRRAWENTQSATKTAREAGCSIALVYQRLHAMGINTTPAVREKPGPKRRPQPIDGDGDAGKTLGELLIFDPPLGSEAGNEIAQRIRAGFNLANDPTGELAERKRMVRDGKWWLPIVDCAMVDQLPDNPDGLHVYRVEIATTEPLCRGCVEQIFALGIPAVHYANGEKIPGDMCGIQADDLPPVPFDDDDEAATL